jgi:hypothetical protein
MSATVPPAGAGGTILRDGVELGQSGESTESTL